MIVIVAAPYIGFPNGMAATSRVTAYARGLASTGAAVHLILLGPSEIDETRALNTETSGVYEGIPFEYMSISTVKSASFFTRQWRLARGMLEARKRIRELSTTSGVEAVLLYARSGWELAFFARVCSSVGAIFAVDLAEMPYHDMPPGAGRDAKQVRYGRRSIGRADLVVAISRYLADYARMYLRPDARVVVLPIMVDCDEFRAEAAPSSNPRYVVYAGILNEPKDGVQTLMRAFASIAGEFPDTILRLVGDSYDPIAASNIPEFSRFAGDLGISDRIEFVGHVPRAVIPGYLMSSAVLALARPSSQQADAGLPTKLGEYLAVGRPVVVTRTSDIGEYLEDGQSAFLAPPDDVEAFAARLRAALSDPGRAEVVGKAGRRVAERFFDYRVGGRLLAEAFDSVRSVRNESP